MHDFKEQYPPTKPSHTEVPEKWKKSPEEWKKLHPLWSYILWDGFASRELIRTKYSWFLPKYDNYRYPIQRVDAARYFILHAYGGIYSDLDLYPIKKIDSYINSNLEAYFTYGCLTVANSFIASTKGANIWNDVFEKLASVKLPFFTKFTKHFTVMLSTGPIFLDTVIREYGDSTLGRLPIGFNNHEITDNSDTPILLSLSGMSWCGIDTYIFNFIAKYVKTLAVIGFILIALIIILAIIFIFRSIKFKKLLDLCRAR
jgi:mannosyltransferase OCH1-like enzyme